MRWSELGLTIFNIRAEKSPFQTPISVPTEFFGKIFSRKSLGFRNCKAGEWAQFIALYGFFDFSNNFLL